MVNQIKDLLLKFDELDRYETPSNFNRNQLKSRVGDLVKELEAVFRLKFTIDEQIQDASFFCDVRISHDLVKSPGKNLGYAIRVSNVGGFATMTFEEAYSEEVRTTIKSILINNKFTFISSEDLEEDYDGSFERFNEILGGPKPTWWIRYFDFL